MESKTVRRFMIIYGVCSCLSLPFVLALHQLVNKILNYQSLCTFTVVIMIAVAEVIKCSVSSAWTPSGSNEWFKKPMASGGRFGEDYGFSGIPVWKNFRKSKVKEILSLLTTFGIMTVAYFVLAVLFGAELLRNQEETLVLSVLLTVLTVLPASFILGVHTFPALILGHKPRDDIGAMVSTNLQMTLLGSWLGATVIPLDWDRPWQEWPLPCFAGAVIGFWVANLLVLINCLFSFSFSSRPRRRKIH